MKKWGVVFHSDNKLDGHREHLICENCLPALFLTRSEARKFREENYGYIKRRPDLRAEPHGWKWPRIVRVNIEFERAP